MPCFFPASVLAIIFCNSVYPIDYAPTQHKACVERYLEIGVDKLEREICERAMLN